MTHCPDLTLAPGCFGWALAFNPDTNECKACPFAAQCSPAADAALVKLRESTGVPTLSKLPPARARRQAEVAAIGMAPALPVKVQALVDVIERKGLKVGESLRAGMNPFDKPAFLRVAAHLLLKLPGGLDRRTLSMALQHKLEWGEATANAHASQVFALLPAIGAGVVMNGKMRISE